MKRDRQILVSFMLKQAKWRLKCPALLEYCCLGCSPYKKCTSVLRWHTALIRQKFRIYHPTIIYFHPKGSKSMDLKLHFRSDNYTWSLSKSWWRVCFRTKKDDLKQSKRNSYRALNWGVQYLQIGTDQVYRIYKYHWDELIYSNGSVGKWFENKQIST